MNNPIAHWYLTNIDPELFKEYVIQLNEAIKDQYFNLIIEWRIWIHEKLTSFNLKLIGSRVQLTTTYQAEHSLWWSTGFIGGMFEK